MARLLIVTLVWLPFAAYLAGFWPGVMTFDSLSQWAQAVGRSPWTDVHPALSTVGFWVAAKLGSPALLAGAQSFFLAWSIVAFGRSVAILGAPSGPVLAAIGAIALAPSVGLFSVTLWKDVPFTAAVLMLGAEVLRMMAVRLRLLGDDTPGAQLILLRRSFVWAVLWASLALLLRQNGIVVAVLVMAAIAVGFPRLRRRAGLVIVGLPVAFLVLRLFVLPGVGVRPAPKSVLYVTIVHEIAGYAHHAPDAFTEQDWAILDTYAPAPVWGAAYDCTSAHPLLAAAGFKPGAIDRWPGPLMRLWTSLIRRRPTVAIGHRLCAAELAWHPFGRDDGWFFTAGRAIERNPFGLKSAPLHAGLDEFLNEAVSITELKGLRPLFWRAPLWIGLAFIVLGREAWRRRRPLWLLAIAPVVAQQVMVAVANPGQDARYMAAAGIASILLLPLALRQEIEDLPGPTVAEEAPPKRKPWNPS
jgi:hypothetical protein